MTRLQGWLFLTVLLVGGVLAMRAQQSADNTVVPQLVKFSGVLLDGTGKPLTGIVGVTFSLYKDQQGGAPLWMETQNVQPDNTGHLFTAGEPRWCVSHQNNAWCAGNRPENRGHTP